MLEKHEKRVFAGQSGECLNQMTIFKLQNMNEILHTYVERHWTCGVTTCGNVKLGWHTIVLAVHELTDGTSAFRLFLAESSSSNFTCCGIFSLADVEKLLRQSIVYNVTT